MGLLAWSIEDWNCKAYIIDPLHVPDQALRGSPSTPDFKRRRAKGSALFGTAVAPTKMKARTMRFKFKAGSIDNHETVAMVVSDDDVDAVVVPDGDGASVRWRLAWTQQGRAPPFECESWRRLLMFLRLVNAAPLEAAALWGLAALPDGGVLVGRHGSVQWEHSVATRLGLAPSAGDGGVLP